MRNPIAKDLHSPKYRQRVVPNKRDARDDDPHLMSADAERKRLLKEIEELEWRNPNDVYLDFLYSELFYVESQIKQGNLYLPKF